MADGPFTALLKALATDGALRAQFNSDPQGVAGAHGLTPAQTAILVSGDANAIEEQLKNESFEAASKDPDYVRGHKLTVLLASLTA